LVINPKEGGRWRVFEKRLLRVVSLFVCKGDDELTGDEKLHDEELHDIFSLHHILLR
jgi:hypothetical protein